MYEKGDVGTTKRWSEAILGGLLFESKPLIFLSAGEASGDVYGAQVIEALRKALPQAVFTGLGGTRMDAAGQQRVVRAEDVAHMGITEVVRHAPYIYGQYRKLVRSVERQKPSVAILIDFPDVNFRLARELKRRDVPVVWFVSPQLWAWKRGRLRWVRDRVDRMLVIFPFEAEFYRNRSVNAEFVGHPLAELAMPSVSREAYAAENRLDPAKAWIALLPGSRWREVEANLPTMVEMACRFPRDCEYILPVASTIDRRRLADFTAGWISHWPGTNPALPLPYIHLVSDTREALYHAHASVVASGTATLEAALIGTPFVVVYKVSRLTYALAKRLVRYPAEISAELDAEGNLPIAMPNLIAGRRIVPELLQDRYTPERLFAELEPLLVDGPPRTRMIGDLLAVRRLLVPASGELRAVERVRDAVLSLLAATN